jgi:hypothetical protein
MTEYLSIYGRKTMIRSQLAALVEPPVSRSHQLFPRVSQTLSDLSALRIEHCRELVVRMERLAEFFEQAQRGSLLLGSSPAEGLYEQLLIECRIKGHACAKVADPRADDCQVAERVTEFLEEVGWPSTVRGFTRSFHELLSELRLRSSPSPIRLGSKTDYFRSEYLIPVLGLLSEVRT